MSAENAGPRDAPAKVSAGGIKKVRNVGLKVVTANDLLDGTVVYLSLKEEWTEILGAAAVVEGKAAMGLLDRALADESRVVGPYLMDVEVRHGRIVPAGRARLREEIREIGPTTHPNYQRPVDRQEDVRVSL